MTKEDKLFYKLHMELLSSNDMSATLDTFFSQNVCIPKGENRHPYADEYHAFLEGTPCEMVWENGGHNEIVYLTLLTFVAREGWSKIRIKPPEPEYEYIWIVKTREGNVLKTSGYMTDEEEVISKHGYHAIPLFRVEETKRLRQ